MPMRLITVSFTELRNLHKLKEKNHLDLGDNVLEHTGSVMPGLTAAPIMSVSLGEITKEGSYFTRIIS